MTVITPELLKSIIADQAEEGLPTNCFDRVIDESLQKLSKNKEIIVLTGVRRCGKSVVLNKLRQRAEEKNYYFNFEDDRLVAFTIDDFQALYEVFLEVFGEEKTFYFDEIQNIPGWELFVRRLYNQGNKIYITGSNATLFSEELGTRLTGRYIQLAIYPFSFFEYAKHESRSLLEKKLRSTKEEGHLKKLFNQYCVIGGIPEYAKYQHTKYLHAVYESIIYRDIIARYKITQVDTLKKLVFFLASNCSKEITYSALRKLLNLGSATTVSDYCSYLEMSYLCFFLNRYHPSVKTQSQSPKKVYFIDHALAKTVGFHFSEDKGRIFENIVFIELKRRNHTVFYHREKKECDFIIQQGTKITAAIQVCYSLSNETTYQREVDGLLDALETYSLSEGLILTSTERRTETIAQNGKQYKIEILPLWQWLIES